MHVIGWRIRGQAVLYGSGDVCWAAAQREFPGRAWQGPVLLAGLMRWYGWLPVDHFAAPVVLEEVLAPVEGPDPFDEAEESEVKT